MHFQIQIETIRNKKVEKTSHYSKKFFAHGNIKNKNPQKQNLQYCPDGSISPNFKLGLIKIAHRVT